MRTGTLKLTTTQLREATRLAMEADMLRCAIDSATDQTIYIPASTRSADHPLGRGVEYVVRAEDIREDLEPRLRRVQASLRKMGIDLEEA